MSAATKPDTDRQRRLAEARARVVTLAIAGQAQWQVREAGLDLPPPAAGYLYVLQAHLLLVPTSAGIAFAQRQAEPAIRAARSDALIVSRPGNGPPVLALGLWTRAATAWPEGLVPWLSRAGALWLSVPSAMTAPLAYELTAAPLKAMPAPWCFTGEFEAGATRAAAWLGSF